MQRSVKTLLFGCLLMLSCGPANAAAQSETEPTRFVAANILGYNHVAGTNINWFTVNGYRARTGGFTCCISLPKNGSRI